MNKKNILIVFIVSLLICLIGLILIALNNRSNTLTSKNNSTSTISYPQINQNVVSYNNISRSQFDENFFNKYITSNVSLTTTPSGDPFYRYFNFGFRNQHTTVYFALVDASTFKTSKELYEKIYTSFTPVGLFISSKEKTLENLTLSMALMNVPKGAGEYSLISGIKNGNKGYYFEVSISPVMQHTLTEEEISSIYDFNYSRNPNEYLTIIKELINENIPPSYFYKFSGEPELQGIDSFRKYNKYKFPTTF